MNSNEPIVVRLPLAHAIASILGKRDHEGYRNVGQNMTTKQLYTLIGLTSSPMLYNYMSGKTKKIEPERALVIYEKFNIIIDDWLTVAELKEDCINKELSQQIAAQPIKGIIGEIVDIEKLDSEAKRTRGLRKLIAKYY